jgi:general secretion pathway protein D
MMHYSSYLSVFMRSIILVGVVFLTACQPGFGVRSTSVDLLDNENDIRSDNPVIENTKKHTAGLLQHKNTIKSIAKIPARPDSGVISSIALSGGNTEKREDVSGQEAQDDTDRTLVEFDFQDISLRELLRLFFEEYLHKPYTVLDDFKDKKVNFVFQGKISKKELFSVFETFLGFHGVSLKFNQGVYAVTTDASRIISLPSSDSLGEAVGIFRCQYIDIKDFQMTGRLFVSNPGSMVVLPSTNSLLVKASNAQIAALKKVHKSIDIPYFKGKYLLVYAPKFLSVPAIKALISKFESQLGGSLGHPNRGIEVEEVSGANKLVIVAANQEIRNKVLQYLAVTDNAEGNQRQMFTYALSNQKSVEILNTVKDILQGVLGGFEKEVNIVADKQTNSLFFMATAEEYAEILKIMDELDHRTPAIHVDVLIAEAVLKDSMQYGVEWFLDKNTSDFLSDIHIDLTDAALAASGAGATLGMASLVSNKFFTLQLLASETDVNVLSNPHIIVKNGATAHINVGQNIAVPKSETTTTAAGSSSQINFDRHDVSVKLEVTPMISPDGTIQLTVKLTDEGLLGFDVTGTQPIFSKRDLSTEMVLNDNQTVLLGGMIQRKNDVKVKKIPFFGDIPYIGYLFRSEDKQGELTELFLMITPKLILDQKGADLVTSAVLEGARIMHERNKKPAFVEKLFQ